MKKSYLHEAKCFVINNGIDTEETFYPCNTNQLRLKLEIDNFKVILTVTDDVFSERKGIDTFIKLADMYKGKNIKFIVVGGVREDLQRDNVIYIPMTTNQKELTEFYALADVFVITSKCDNFPTVCLEALACGTPVVGFDVGGIAETAPQMGIGRFVEMNDLEEMVKAIDYFLMEESLKNIKKCRSYATLYFSKQHMNNKYIKLFQELIRSGEE